MNEYLDKAIKNVQMLKMFFALSSLEKQNMKEKIN